MTAAISKNNEVKKKSATKEYFRMRLHENRMAFLLMCIIELLGAPLIALALVLNDDTKEFYLCVGIAMIVIGALTGAFFVVRNFSCHIKKTDVDMIYSLPVSKVSALFRTIFRDLSST